MTRLSGQQNQALVFVAYREGAKPSRRALEQLQEMGLVIPPTPRDRCWRLTQEGGKLLRSSGLARATANMPSRTMVRPRVA